MATSAGALQPTVYTLWHRERSGKPWVQILATEDFDEAAEAEEKLQGDTWIATVRDPLLVGRDEDNTGRPRRNKPKPDKATRGVPEGQLLLTDAPAVRCPLSFSEVPVPVVAAAPESRTAEGGQPGLALPHIHGRMEVEAAMATETLEATQPAGVPLPTETALPELLLGGLTTRRLAEVLGVTVDRLRHVLRKNPKLRGSFIWIGPTRVLPTCQRDRFIAAFRAIEAARDGGPVGAEKVDI